MTDRRLEGRSILLVEDEFFQAMDAKQWLEQAGAEVVGPTAFADEVPGLLRKRKIDAAVLDINLGAGADYAVPRLLNDAGVPFLFLTGYGSDSISEEFASTPCLSKPADERKAIKAVEGLVGG